MSAWRELFNIFVMRNRHLDRIATALERITPEPEPPVELKPADAVTYVDEVADAEREEAERTDAVVKWLNDHPDEAMPEGFGEGDVR